VVTLGGLPVRALKVLAIVGAVAIGGCQTSTQQHKATPSATIPVTSAVVTTPPQTLASAAQSEPSSATPVTPRTAPATTPTVPVASSPNAAMTQLATLAVKGRAPMTGYSRAQFGPAWPTENGCDARNEVLRRDLTNTTLQGNCTVETGTLISPYTGGTISFVRGPNSAIVQIDHVVPLGDAWQKGAQTWTAAKRETFANDPAELLAVDAHSNEQKGDGDAATWLPANKPFRCAYVAIQVSVKATYGLWVTQAEHDAIARVLGTCGTTAATSSTVPSIAPSPQPAATTPAPVVAPPTPTPAATHTYVTPGAFCTPAGATGYSKTGKPEICKTTTTDSRLRWRAA
jgi:Protein of unknown function (DUF1524)